MWENEELSRNLVREDYTAAIFFKIFRTMAWLYSYESSSHADFKDVCFVELALKLAELQQFDFADIF